MDLGPDFPFTASVWKLLSITAASAVITGLVCAFVLKLDKGGWKRLDYWWLGFASLGLFGAASSVRKSVAPALLEWRRAVMVHHYEMARSNAEFLASNVFCRSIPETDEVALERVGPLNREYAAVCDFGRTVGAALPESVPDSLATFGLLRPPEPMDVALLGSVRGLTEELEWFSQAATAWRAAQEASEESYFESILHILSPFLVAVALGVRVAKVWGELRLDP